jgi:hypothetical protein
MNEPATLQTLAVRRVINEIDLLKDGLRTHKGMLMQLEARINGFVAEMREWQQSRPDESQHER